MDCCQILRVGACRTLVEAVLCVSFSRGDTIINVDVVHWIDGQVQCENGVVSGERVATRFCIKNTIKIHTLTFTNAGVQGDVNGVNRYRVVRCVVVYRYVIHIKVIAVIGGGLENQICVIILGWNDN